MALPVVSIETGNAILRELRGDSGGEQVHELLSRLEESNPCIARFINQLSARNPESAEIYAAALIVYRLLESQDEADRLKEEFLWEDTLRSRRSEAPAPEAKR